jgi:hypothetical protein
VKKAGDLPDEMINQVRGEILVQDQGMQILPIMNSDNYEINENSKRLIQMAIQTYIKEKRVLQVTKIIKSIIS